MARYTEIVRVLAKKCSKCDELKALGEYYVDRSLPSGRRIYCKSCDNKHRKMNREKKREQFEFEKDLERTAALINVLLK